MEYVFLNGGVAILVRYCEEHYEEVDGGARIDFRRIEEYDGANGRPGTGGYRILPVSDGGIWRIDLSTRIDSDVPEQRYHHHPNFQGGDVGPRVFDAELSADPLGWIERRLLDLPSVLDAKGFGDLAKTIDMDEMATTLPAIRQAIEASLALLPVAG